MEPATRRFEVLTTWKAGVATSGQHLVPAATSLRAIADAGRWPDGLSDDAADRWRPTIEWLLKQLKFGVANPVDQLPTELRSPLPPTAPVVVVPAKPAEPPAVVALLQWRDAGIARNVAGFASLKDAQVRQIVRSGLRSTDDVAKLLPPALKSLGRQVADVLATVQDGREDSALPVPAGASASVRTSAARSGQPAATKTVDPTPIPLASRTSSGSVWPAVSPAPVRPVAEPAAAAVALAVPDPVSEIDPQSFDQYAYGVVTAAPVPVVASVTGSGGMSLSWPAATSASNLTVFRVVFGDDYAPYAPEVAATVAITERARAVDDEPFTSAVRHYQVWRNSGTDVEDVLHSQPVLHAEASVVGPVIDLDIKQDEGRVIGQWRVLPGIQRVQVFRVPIAAVAHATNAPEFRIHADRDNLGGFVDADASPGERYVYLVCAEAQVDGVTRLSAQLRVPVTRQAVLSPVTDLVVELHGTDIDPQFDLRWSNPPAGRVIVFRTEKGPQAGAASEARPESALPQMELVDASRLSHPIGVEEAGHASMRDVPWPRGWTRTYFTPVTVLDGIAHVGKTISATRVGRIGDPRIVERVEREILTFEWPSGAASVLVYVAPPGASAEQARGGRPSEISANEYREAGGLSFAAQLPAGGCSVHAVAVAFAGGERIDGEAVSLDYPGLLRLRYRLVLRRGLTGRPTNLTLTITSAVALTSAPPFVLVHNPDRLPLDVTDGAALEVVRDGDETLAVTRRFVPARLSPEEDQVAWKADVRDRTGFVRLFVDLPPERLVQVALLDPAVKQLRLDSYFGNRG